jgi:hypothetical protein
MKKDKVKILFEELTFGADYEIFDEGKENDKLKEVAKKRGIKIPSQDLAFFSCKYAMVDKKNLNGCILPKSEVKKALDTLNGKAIDRDHLRKSTIGVWLDAELENDVIVAYGSFWKSNFPEDYEEIKKRMSEGKMKISFEAWGDREFIDEKTYNLKNCHFAGGALLFDTQPAFPDAEVMEMSNKVLEFAKIIEEVKVEEPKVEEARLYFNYDNETIARLLIESECPSCQTKGWNDVLNIDFEKSKVKSKCPVCSGINEYNLTPSVSIIKKGKKPDYLKAEEETKTKINKEGGNEVMDELLKKYNKASAEELIKFLESEIDNQKQIVGKKDQELASLKTEKDSLSKLVEESKLMIENSKLEIEKVKTEHATIKAELNKRLAEEKAAIVKTRKDSLGEFAKDISDEDILNDLKFENAKLKKELAEAKSKPAGGGLDAGATTKDKDVTFTDKQKRIQDKAWKQEKTE